jgi:hypothetical protein
MTNIVNAFKNLPSDLIFKSRTDSDFEKIWRSNKIELDEINRIEEIIQNMVVVHGISVLKAYSVSASKEVEFIIRNNKIINFREDFICE